MYDSKTDSGLYANKQNAHDEDISAAALIAAQKVMLWYQKNPVDAELIDKSYKGDWGLWVKTHLMKTGKFNTTTERRP